MLGDISNQLRAATASTADGTNNCKQANAATHTQQGRPQVAEGWAPNLNLGERARVVPVTTRMTLTRCVFGSKFHGFVVVARTDRPVVVAVLCPHLPGYLRPAYLAWRLFCRRQALNLTNSSDARVATAFFALVRIRRANRS